MILQFLSQEVELQSLQILGDLLTWATYAPRDMTTVIKYYMVIKLDEKKICHGRPCPCPRQKYL